MAKALTVKGIEAARASGNSRREIPDGLIAGLYLVVQPSGSKSWAVRYRSGGRTRKLTLGAWPGIKLPDARELASRALRSVAEGEDPGRQKQEARRVAKTQEPDRDLIETVAASFVQRYAKANTREGTWRETERILSKVLAADAWPRWRGKRVQDFSRRDVVELLDAISDRGSPIMANRTLATIRRMFAWCVERSLIEVSPCQGVRAPAPEVTRDRVLTDTELRSVWHACDALGRPFGPIIRLLILTAQRREEVTGMRWSEVDFATKTWTIPRDRAKNDVEHVVPLCAQAMEIIRDQPRIRGKEGFVFTTTGDTSVSGHSRAKARLDAELLRRAKEVAGDQADEVEPWPRWTLHDLRRTAASGMARLGQPVHVVEAVLNHRSGTIKGVARVYNRYSYDAEKREALEGWAAFLTSLTIEGAPKS